MSSFPITPIGYIHTPFRQKFAIPRQPGLVNAAKGRIDLCGEANDINCARGLEQFSHLWLIFQFHETQQQGWRPTVRPPRLGGNDKLGVFATRSTFRPNNLGLSVVRLIEVCQHNGQVSVVVSGIDLLDKTPIIDIKPYLPYADAIPDAQGGFAQTPPASMAVEFTPEAQQQLNDNAAHYPDLEALICQVLSQDPRPAYQRSPSQRIYHVQFWELDVHWRVENDKNLVCAISKSAHATTG